MADFVAPPIVHNPDGWGPTGTLEQFAGLPLLSFNKNDKLGRAADWGMISAPQYRGGWRAPAANSMFAQAQENENTFVTVDSRAPKKPANTKKIGAGPRIRKDDRSKPTRSTPSTAGINQNVFRRAARFDEGGAKGPEASIEVKPTWRNAGSISLTQLAKLSGPVPAADDLISCGSVGVYDRSVEKILARSEKKLDKTPVKPVHENVTVFDPIIRELTVKLTGNVYATDSVLATLACSPRSIYSWDLVVHKVNNTLFISHRNDDDHSRLTVNENCAELPPEDDSINSASSLSKEASTINSLFHNQTLLKTKSQTMKLQRPNPFGAQGLSSSVGYRYRKWNLGDDIVLVARTRVDACTPASKEQEKPLFYNIHALNEYDPRFSGVDWRQKVDSHRGAILSSECKNNAHKLCNWVTRAMLGDVESMKIGFVSRASIKDANNHTVLAVSSFKPKEFAPQIDLQPDNIWAILKKIIETLRKLPDGKHVLLREPAQPIITIYSVPEDDDEDDDGEDGEKDGQNEGAE